MAKGKGSGKSSGKGTRARSAISGKFVTKKHAAQSKRTTVIEKVD